MPAMPSKRQKACEKLEADENSADKNQGEVQDCKFIPAVNLYTCSGIRGEVIYYYSFKNDFFSKRSYLWIITVNFFLT